MCGWVGEIKIKANSAQYQLKLLTGADLGNNNISGSERANTHNRTEGRRFKLLQTDYIVTNIGKVTSTQQITAPNYDSTSMTNIHCRRHKDDFGWLQEVLIDINDIQKTLDTLLIVVYLKDEVNPDGLHLQKRKKQRCFSVKLLL